MRRQVVRSFPHQVALPWHIVEGTTAFTGDVAEILLRYHRLKLVIKNVSLGCRVAVYDAIMVPEWWDSWCLMFLPFDKGPKLLRFCLASELITSCTYESWSWRIVLWHVTLRCLYLRMSLAFPFALTFLKAQCLRRVRRKVVVFIHGLVGRERVHLCGMCWSVMLAMPSRNEFQQKSTDW